MGIIMKDGHQYGAGGVIEENCKVMVVTLDQYNQPDIPYAEVLDAVNNGIIPIIRNTTNDTYYYSGMNGSSMVFTPHIRNTTRNITKLSFSSSYIAPSTTELTLNYNTWISPSSWVDSETTIYSSNITTSSIITLTYPITTTDEEYNAIQSARIRAVAQANESITLHAFGIIPTISIPINIILQR